MKLEELIPLFPSEPNSKITVKKKTDGITLQTPYDPDVSYGHKGAGYSLHIAETCNNPDKPETLFADGGYPSVPPALKITEQQIEFMTPVNRGPMDDDVVGRDRFQFDSSGHVTKCPMGHRPIDHRIVSSNNKTNRALHDIFDGNTCRACSMLDRCPVRAPSHRGRGCKAKDTVGNFRLKISAELRWRDQMYADQQTPQWKERYKIRSEEAMWSFIQNEQVPSNENPFCVQSCIL